MKQNKDNQNKKQRSGFAVMCGLIGMIKPLLGIMCLAILMGCAGNLMATFLTILGGYALLTVTGVYSGMKFSVIFTLLVCFAVARGILRQSGRAYSIRFSRPRHFAAPMSRMYVASREISGVPVRRLSEFSCGC